VLFTVQHNFEHAYASDDSTAQRIITVAEYRLQTATGPQMIALVSRRSS
jgi:hypothetical protein